MSLPVNLQQSETLVTVQKRHPVYVILKGVTAVILGIIVAWLLRLVPWFEPYWIWLAVGIGVIVALYIGVLLYRYYNDLWIVTNQRLVDSLKTTPFNHQISSTDLVNLQDIDVRKRGIVATIFNFGDVICQTASTDGEFIFVGVGDPAGLMELLDRLRDEARHQNQQVIGRAVGQASAQQAT